MKSAFCQRVPTVKNVRLSLRIEISIVSSISITWRCWCCHVVQSEHRTFWKSIPFLRWLLWQCLSLLQDAQTWPDAKDGHPEKARHHFYLRQMLCWCQKRYTPQSRSSFRRVKVAFLPARQFWNTLYWSTLGTFGRKRVKHWAKNNIWIKTPSDIQRIKVTKHVARLWKRWTSRVCM